MKITIIVLAMLLQLLGACASPIGKLDLKDGETGCITANSLTLGKASMIVARADNITKNQTNKGDISITCGEAVMNIKTDTGVVVPPGATTTTTTTVVPAKPPGTP